MDINIFVNDNYREIKLKTQSRFNFDKVDSNYAENLIRDLEGGYNGIKWNSQKIKRCMH